MSSFQFKYLGDGQNWYRMGEVTLPERMSQALKLQPDFVEIITWNDAGESHNVGNFWSEQLAGTEIEAYNKGFDHKGWLQIITPFIKAYKAGATSISDIAAPGTEPVGTLWYRTLLTSASCSSSIDNHESGRDTMNFAVILPADGYKIKVYSNDKLIGTFDGQKGLNYNSVLGLTAGSGQRLEVVDTSDKVVTSATGTKDVEAESSTDICNWNYEVVGLASSGQATGSPSPAVSSSAVSGSAVSTPLVPSSAVPNSAVASSAVATPAVPESAVATPAVPAAAGPTAAVCQLM